MPVTYIKTFHMRHVIKDSFITLMYTHNLKLEFLNAAMAQLVFSPVQACDILFSYLTSSSDISATIFRSHYLPTCCSYSMCPNYLVFIMGGLIFHCSFTSKN